MMKKSRRDQILTTAFGDADALDLNGLTDEERAEFEDARQLSEGLKTLREVPECQLSTERLVAAVLSNAVKKRQTFGWGHAAAAAAFGVMAIFALQSSLFNFGEESEGNVAFGPPVTEGAVGTINVPVPGAPPSADSSEVDIEHSAGPSTDDVAPPAPMVPEDVAQPSETPVPPPIAVVVASNDSLGATMEPAALRAGDVAEITTVALEASEPEARQPLVIVDSAYEDENGTFVAIEVETFGDVVFGG
ncbi:MAG: hypothetical protein IH945_02770 [Armatimonadetes bacterium]|nr:hypothetical protein [Armatimonadota bacterium]